ncbi:hypothetical protein GCM10009069_04820 [Algimonas arctica]|uniref:Lipoprotein n=1 Tax=Algimonas arctica TaxID=1479486 RepID=A0A8J3CM10_9PROT|nr:hypothetical protein [Algimonas arctica]GHA84738.1 hypothetical protein GCM10009069_04820 [Algimonas arctica]
MQKFIIPLALMSGLFMSGCVHPTEDTLVVSNSDRDAVKNPKNSASQTQNSSILSEPKTTPSQTMTQNMIPPSQEYWVIRPGTVVYNAAREPVRSLRLQPKVYLHDVVDGWGLIDAAKGEWVKMSDVSPDQPADTLAAPENSTELPRVTVEDMMKPQLK